MSSRFAASPSILSFMADSPNYGKLASAGTMERAKSAAMKLRGDAGIQAAGISGQARKAGAKYGAKAAIAQGESDGYSSMMGGIASGVGSIAGGFADRPSANGGEDSISGYGMNSFKDMTGEFNKPADMRGFGFSPSSTMYSGFPNQDLG